MVSAAFLAAYNPLTFYTIIMMAVFTPFRGIVIFGSWTGFIYECTDPIAVIKVIEACYIFRHEEKLVAEEESYRMLQEIMRSPGLLKAMSGSSLRGECDPVLDSLDEVKRNKLIHL